MPRLASKLLFGLTAVSLVLSSTALDAKELPKRRIGFFESLFGSTKRQSRNSDFGNQDGQGLTWWEQQQLKRRQNNINIIYGDGTEGQPVKKKKKPTVSPAEFTEPEPLPGLGMGTMAYQPPLVGPVFDASLAKLTTTNPEAESVWLALLNRNTKIRAVEIERKAVVAFYKANNFAPVWTAGGHITERASSLLKILSESASDGLVPFNYVPAEFNSFDGIDDEIAGDQQKLGLFDVALTAQALKYARHLSGGQFDPNRLSLYNDIKPEFVNADTVLRVVAHSPFLEAYFSSLAPKNPQYAIFKEALNKSKGDAPAIEAIADGPTVKVGTSDPRIPIIRTKLQELNLVAEDELIISDDQILDQVTSKALKKFQKANKLKQTGSLDAITVKTFNKDNRGDDRQRLVYNMERLRWLPKNLGARYVLVNQPAFEVNVMDQGKSIWTSRVVVGRPLTQTYAFSDTIETVVFNPTWGVPASIIVNEYGPKSRKDPGYLDRNGFKVINSKGDVVSSKSIDWYNMGQAPNFGVQQPSGDGNALGEVKFVFPNAHDIYMHDTPSRNLFADTIRAYSHGCVRVQNPREFAEVLLGWTQDDIAATISTGEALPVSLKQKTPVHITYFTAWPDSSGKIRYYDDIYGRDAAIAKALAFGTAPKKPADSEKIVENASISGELIQN
jgi:murein L,D-transpeptidase YcbB/YkuD